MLNNQKFLNKIQNDKFKERRLQLQECKKCFYSTTLVGRAFTNSNCVQCNVFMTFTSTDIKMFCERCSREKEICRNCGTKID